MGVSIAPLARAVEPEAELDLRLVRVARDPGAAHGGGSLARTRAPRSPSGLARYTGRLAMGKAHRSPLLGYNHNVGHLGYVFHVQTEDSGPAAPRLFTHMFYEGTILVSRKIEYEAMTPDDKVRALMQAQHRSVIKDMTSGIFNERIVAFFRARGVTLEAPPVDAPAAGAVAAPVAPAAPPSPAAVDPAAPVRAPRRTTRPIESQRPQKSPAIPITVRAADPRRPPFVRSNVPPTTTTASADGVVVQRNVVVGATPPEAPARIRPPVPYVVTGGTHPVRHAPLDDPAEQVVDNTVHADQGPPPAASAEAAPPREGAFGHAVSDDKSLDEVILEYLSEDGETS